MLEKNKTIAIAESATSRLLQHAFGSIENASQFYHGGITVYNIGQKSKHLNVGPIHALKVNCVSEKVVSEMALGVICLFKSDCSISTTGYASPVPESGNKLFAYFAIAFDNKIERSDKLTTTLRDPDNVKTFYIQKMLEKFVAILKKQG